MSEIFVNSANKENRHRQSHTPLPVILSNLKGLTNRPKVCLTFDDGPDPKFTPRILDILAEHNVLATFFVVGQSAEEHPKIIERMANAGHTIGNHTFDHRHPWVMLPKQVRKQISSASEIITRITGKPSRWFRPPHGRLRNAIIQQANSENMTVVLWSHSIIDWGPLATESAIKSRLQKVAPADIVLMHDGERQHNRPDITAKLLAAAIEDIKQRGMSLAGLNAFL